MKTVAWKDIRQNLPWAALALLISGGAMMYSFALVRSAPYQSYEGLSICSSQFLLPITLCSALWGLATGLLLTIPDANRDRRSFLLHRPSSWTSIFLAKLAAAFALTVVPISVPFLLFSIWASRPGTIAAPFDWRMMAPGMMDILTGFVFAVAGMLTGLRPVRWYASRGLGIVAAVVGALLVHGVESFFAALLILIGVSATLGLAAWGSFLTGGGYRPQPVIAKIALGLCVLVGLLMVCSVAAGALAFLGAVQVRSFKQYIVDKNGRILITHYNSGIGVPDRVTDLKGETIPEFSGVQGWTGGMLQGAGLMAGRKPYRLGGYRDANRLFTLLNEPYGTDGRQIWFYDHRRGLGLGYGSLSRRLEETLGPIGFASADRQNQPFEGEMQTFGYYAGILIFPKEVFYADFQGRTIQRVFQSGPEIRSAAICLNAGAPTMGLRFCAVIAGSRLHVVTLEGASILETELTQDLAKYDQVSVYLTAIDGKRLVWYKPSYEIPSETRATMPEYVEEYGLSGERKATQTLPPLDVAAPSSDDAVAVMTMSLLPPSFLAGLRLIPDLRETMFPEAFARMLAASIAMALVCSALCFWLCRRHAASPAALWGWSVLVLLLGPLGLLTFAALQEWPARVACAGCGKRRVVTRARCEHCGAPFPPADRLGTEIFETT